MSRNDDFIGQLEDYLVAFDGVTPLPDRVRDAIRAELPSARQVRPRLGPLRVFTMLSTASAGARVGLAAATIVVAVVLGGAFLNNRSGGIVGGGPTPTPTATLVPTQAPTSNPTSAPTVAPSVSALPPSLAAAAYVACAPADTGTSCLAPGTYQLSGGRADWPVTVTIDVPAGWFEWGGGAGWDAVLVASPPAFDASGWGVMFTSVSDVYRDACDVSKGTIPADQVDTPQKLAAAIAAWPGFTATAPRAITVDGHSALEFTLKGTSKTARCGSGDSWLTLSHVAVDAYPMANSYGSAYPTTVRIIDTGHGLLVIRATDFPETSPNELDGGTSQSATRHAADQPGLHAILDSVRLITPTSP